MIRLVRHYDVNGDLIQEDGDRDLKDRVLKPGESVRVPLFWMDGKSAPPPGYYVLHDGAGRPCGLGRVDLAEKAAAARADYRERLSNAHKRLVPVRDYRSSSTSVADEMTIKGDNVTLDPRLAAYRAYVARLQSAHRRV